MHALTIHALTVQHAKQVLPDTFVYVPHATQELTVNHSQTLALTTHARMEVNVTVMDAAAILAVVHLDTQETLAQFSIHA